MPPVSFHIGNKPTVFITDEVIFDIYRMASYLAHQMDTIFLGTEGAGDTVYVHLYRETPMELFELF